MTATIEHLTVINALVRALADEGGLTEARMYRLRLATEELFVNIVQHGYPPAAVGKVVVEGHISADRVSVRLIDSAPRFNPLHVPTPANLDEPLSHRAPGSLGLYLASRAADAASHEYINDTNRTTVSIWRTDPEGSGGEADADRDTHRE
jgi:serine/threonine-protein kinase RsbW